MNTPKLSDRDLIRMMKGSDAELEQALRYLEIEEKQSLYIKKLIYKMGGKEFEYEEIMNDVLRALYVSVVGRRFKEDYPIKSYMAGTARNIWYKRLRQKKMMTTEFQPVMSKQEPSFEVQIIEDERRKALHELLERIGDKCKNILVKSKLEGYTYKELVELTEYKNEAMIRKKVCECMKRLARLIEENPQIINHLRS